MSDNPEEQAFLAAIRTDPLNDLPRLVYADWLIEHGRDEFAELIQLQCDLARTHKCKVVARANSGFHCYTLHHPPGFHPCSRCWARRADLEREKALMAKVYPASALLRDIAPGATVAVTRGFPWRVTATWEWHVQHLKRVASQHPLTRAVVVWAGHTPHSRPIESPGAPFFRLGPRVNEFVTLDGYHNWVRDGFIDPDNLAHHEWDTETDQPLWAYANSMFHSLSDHLTERHLTRGPQS